MRCILCAGGGIIISGPVPVPNEHFPRSSIGLGLMIPLRYACPLAALLAICLLLDQVAAAPLPGVAWSKLEIWEGSAAADVWLYAELITPSLPDESTVFCPLSSKRTKRVEV